MTPSAIKTILCPNCRKLISTDEARCPYCGTVKPGSWMHNNPVARLFNDPARFIKGIIYVNVGMFALTVLISFQHLSLSMGNPLHFLSPSLLSLRLFGDRPAHLPSTTCTAGGPFYRPIIFTAVSCTFCSI